MEVAISSTTRPDYDRCKRSIVVLSCAVQRMVHLFRDIILAESNQKIMLPMV